MIYIDGIGLSFLIKEVKEKIVNYRLTKIYQYDRSSLSFFLFFSTASARGPKALAKTPVIKGKMVITAASDMAKPRMPPQTSKLARFFKLPRIPIIIPSKKPRVMGSPKIPSLVFSDSGLSLTLLIPIRFHSGSNTKAGIKVSIL